MTPSWGPGRTMRSTSVNRQRRRCRVDRLLLEADPDGEGTARYLGMPESTLDVWLLDRDQTPLVHAVQPERRGWPRVPFVGVIEAYVLRAFAT